MNKFIKILVFVFFATLSNCKTVNEGVKIELVETTQPVLLRKLTDTKKELSINIPVKFLISNNSFNKRCFYDISYLYHKEKKGNIILFFKNKEGKFEYIYNRKKQQCIDGYEKREYFFYTSKHFVDTTRLIQSNLKLFLSKMKVLDKDTLELGTFKNFKPKHTKLLEYLLDKDSIYISFEKKSGKGHDEYIIPVKL